MAEETDSKVSDQISHRDDLMDENKVIINEGARILSSALLKRSPILSQLLNFLIKHHVNHHDGTLRAYDIAVHALGRDPNFDPIADSYPRVQMSRLRRLLDEYYSKNEGVARLYIPRNNYCILVKWLDDKPLLAKYSADPGEEMLLQAKKASALSGISDTQVSPSQNKENSKAPCTIETNDQNIVKVMERIFYALIMVGTGSILIAACAIYYLFQRS